MAFINYSQSKRVLREIVECSLLDTSIPKGLIHMRFTFTGKNLTVSDKLKEHAEAKLGKLGKLIYGDPEVTVAFSVNKLDHKIEVTIPLQKRILRAEVTASDMYAAIDSVVDALEKQVVKYKERLRQRSRKSDSFKAEYDATFTAEEPAADGNGGVVIDRTKRFALKPMDAEEAAMEMELLGHNFYVFRNGGNDEVNVVYKRKDGTYGLIEPEY